ncbi:LysR family transcriptional regulator [Sphingomonas sp. BIUV-7]|uniref:LysR family transcriptional regulator n=1 Tax=Sphingomonas natans TaxID=3063330 RepID=A0ABT8YB64_9SPHN|nr:LysR family transcriptional regulator [Sphingomonas sp. BIUV-7]MDO6415578.1 LysR family transcriptional regulator [Sphingomonas sp. BIUV-7]
MTSAHDLNLRHLRMLPLIADSGSLSAAAKAASISQPALTQALAKLEAGFGTVLFDRTSGGVFPTPSGRRVLQRVDRALRSLAVACRRCAKNIPAAQFENYLTTAHVRGLMALAEAGSFVRAAEEAGLSVPSLHRAVRELEKLSGTALVERRGRGVGLTRAGAKLARGFTIGVTELGAAIEETADGGGRLSIGAMALSRSHLLPATLAELLRERPDVRVDVVEGSYLELVELLRSGRIDILIGALRDVPGRDLFQEPLFTDRLTVIGRAEHPLAGTVADFDQLSEHPWIVARRASGLLDRWQQMFDRSGKARPEAPIQCGSVALIRGLLLRTDFLTLLSTDQVRSEIEAGTLVKIESDVPDTMRTIGAITRRDWFPTKLQDVFMVALRRTGREAMPG